MVHQIPAEANIYDVVTDAVEGAKLEPGVDHITKIVIAGHGSEAGSIGTLNGGMSDITLAELQDEQPTPSNMAFDFLKPYTQGHCSVYLRACYTASDNGRKMMQIISDTLQATVVGWEDQYAVVGWGDRYTVDKEGNWSKKEGPAWEDSFAKHTLGYLGHLGWEYIGVE